MQTDMQHAGRLMIKLFGPLTRSITDQGFKTLMSGIKGLREFFILNIEMRNNKEILYLYSQIIFFA